LDCPDCILAPFVGLWQGAYTAPNAVSSGSGGHDARRDLLVRHGRVYAVDASSYFSRPGPRLVDGVEILAALLHPDRERPSTETAWIRLRE